MEEGISREKLSELISSQKFGIHGHNFEHFGMAIAEMITGGFIVFSPNGGGQVEIVNGCEEVRMPVKSGSRANANGWCDVDGKGLFHFRYHARLFVVWIDIIVTG